MRKRIKIGLIIIVAVLLGLVGVFWFGLHLMSDEDKHIDISYLKTELQDGDLIFQTSKSRQSKAIQLATKSKFSHMGMIYKKNNKVYVFEAVQPVKLTPVNEWINRGEHGYFVIKRLKNADKILTPDVKAKMKAIGQKYLGKDYDIYFEWSDDKIYCSELVWKIYKEAANIEIGKLERLKDFDLSSGMVRKLMHERYGDKVPNNEVVISPISMFKCDKLETVYEE